MFVNLLSSGNAAVWLAYAWDGENRLVGVGPGGTPKSGDLKLAFVYDYMGRRVQKKVWTHNGSSWGDPTEHRKFVWNGWLLLMELDGLNDDAVLRKRTWGLDLAGLTGGGSSAGLASSRSMLEGAGGIGGLLAVYDTNGTTTGENPEVDDMAYVYLYDANGNVGQVVDLSHTPGDPAGAIVARYEYDPYGNVTSQSGAYAATNPFRFSTKYWDDETGLGYWGYRYYDPKLGRWGNRDPVGECGGTNLYAYAFNGPTTSCDGLGDLVVAGAFGCPVQEKPTSQPASQPADDDLDDICRKSSSLGGAHADASGRTVCDGRGGFVVCVLTPSGWKGSRPGAPPPKLPPRPAADDSEDVRTQYRNELTAYCSHLVEHGHAARLNEHWPNACQGRPVGSHPKPRPDKHDSEINNFCPRVWSELMAYHQAMDCVRDNAAPGDEEWTNAVLDKLDALVEKHRAALLKCYEAGWRSPDWPKPRRTRR